jgi:predicted transposase YdaD
LRNVAYPNAAQVQLISGFIDTYLELNSQEEVVFQEQLVTIEPKQQEEVMQIVTSWMRQGLEQGEKQGELKLLMRLLNRRLGEISPQLKGRIENLSTPELENLGEALLDFSSVADLEAWFENIS